MRGLLVALALAGTLAGCDSVPSDAPPREEVAPPPEDPPADALEARLRALGAERAPYMIREGPAMRGEAEEGAIRDFSRVVHPGWCYKLIGLGGEGVEDLDLRVYDDNDVLLQRDTTRDPRPYIGQMRPICPGRAAIYHIQVRVVAGRGPFAVQLYRSL